MGTDLWCPDGASAGMLEVGVGVETWVGALTGAGVETGEDKRGSIKEKNNKNKTKIEAKYALSC